MGSSRPQNLNPGAPGPGSRPPTRARWGASLWDAVIVGGGPAGLVAARDLAHAGHSTLVLEEHESIGYPVHCTGLLGLEAFDELNLPRQSVLGVARSARFRAASGLSVLVETPNVAAAIVDRGAFDMALGAQAAAAGAAIRTSTRVEDISLHEDHVSVTQADGARVTGRVCVLACGARYRFHRRLGLGLPHDYLQSAQIETPLAGAPNIDVQFGREAAPGGFAWRVPFQRNGEAFARIGVMCESAAADRLNRFASSLACAAQVDPATVPLPRRRMLPLGPVRRTFAQRLVAIGDAAGLVKPTTGGGIYFGLLSGQLAAQVLDEQLRRDRLDDAHLSRHELEWKARLGPEIRAGLVFRRLVTRLDDAAMDALVGLALTNGLIPLLKRTAIFNWHRGAVKALLKHGDFRKILLRALWA